MRFIWFLVAKYRLYKNKEDRNCINEKFGFANKKYLKQLEEYKEECKKNKVEAKVVLIHAVSVGESNSVLPIVSKLLEKNFFVVFTTTTVTSANLIKQKLQKNFIHQYCVYPNKTFIQRFYNNWRPTKVFFVESEIFPSIVSFLKKQKCEIYLLNGRISEKSYKRWKIVKFYIKNILKKYDCIFTQNEDESQKFKTLSNNLSNIQCFGNLKFESSIVSAKLITKQFENEADSIIAKCKLLSKNKENRKIIVFASIHESEFLHIIWQYSVLLKKINCIGVFVPRHIEKNEILSKEFYKNDINFTFFSDFCGGNFANTIIVDQFGILNYIYNICDYAVVCGSFSADIGGHNPLESIALNKPTIIGKFCHKNNNIVNDLLRHKALIQTSNISAEILNLIKNKDLETELVNNGKKLLSANNNTVDKILHYLSIG